jgi:hypothetical protein
VRHLDPSTSTAWFSELQAWAANITFSGLTTFAEVTIKLDPLGRILPIAGHDVASVLNMQLQHEILRLLQISCTRLDVPSLSAINAMPEGEVILQF